MAGKAMDVRGVLSETTAELSQIRDGDRLVEVLKNIKRYMNEDATIPPSEKAEFVRVHYTPFLRILVKNMGLRWVDLLTLERLALWDSFFLEGPPDQAFLVLLDSMDQSGPSICLDRCVYVLERFIQLGQLTDLMWEVCKQQLESTPTPLMHEAVLGRICSLPDYLANCLKTRNKPLFFTKNYYPRLAGAIILVLRLVSDSLREGKNCSISFVSQVLGKVCMQGHQVAVLSVLIPHLLSLVQSDCIWQRLCWRLLAAVPDRWMDAVVTGILEVARGPSEVSKLLGDLVLKSKKVEYLLTQKMLFLQYCAPKEKLQSVLGYLSLESSRRPLLGKVLRELLEVWSSASVVKHSPHAQLLHLSRSVLICQSLMNKEEFETCQEEVMHALVNGLPAYLNSSISATRTLGMIVCECLSERLNPKWQKMTFKYEEDEEAKDLKSLLCPPCICSTDAAEPVSMPGDSSPSNVSPPSNDDVKPEEGSRSESRSDSELDSDDDLTPYDMSEDIELKKSRAPAYIRDCMEVLLSDDLEKLEVTMITLPALIHANTAATKEVSVELAKILLHLDDQPGIKRFEALRRDALVAVIVVDPVLVSKYLSGEFYSLNYNLRQRMDILDALASAAKELSELVAPSKSIGQQGQSAPKVKPANSDAPIDWRKIVDDRIKKKTRRFAKGSSVPGVAATPNSYHAVAGHLFFPLIHNFDRPVVTFDLLGDDQLVLGRLVHTLGILMHLALNATVAPQMGRALLEFVLALRFHLDTYVRQGLLFCISTILLSVPFEKLVVDMTDELIETQHWLSDMADKDVDDACRRAALSGLVLMEKLKNFMHGGKKH